MARTAFRFAPRWKEELVVTGPGGASILDLPMGVLTAVLPAEPAWRATAPAWAADQWPTLKAELEDWCLANDARLEISETAAVYPFQGPPAFARPGQIRWTAWLLIAVLFAATGWILLG